MTPNFNAIESMVDDLIRHDIEKIERIVTDRVKMLKGSAEKTVYITMLCRALYIHTFELNTCIVEMTMEQSRAAAQAWLLDVVPKGLKSYVKQNPRSP